MTQAEPLITAENISYVQQHKTILDDVSLEVLPGESITIIGPNGAGKSTLLKIMLGLDSSTAGKVWRKPALRVGYMPQSIQLNSLLPITVNRFLALGSKKSMRYDIPELLQEVGISKLAEQSMHTLSGGEMQRVLLARSLKHKPELLVLDEPAQSLDISGQIAIYQKIKEIQEQRECTILMVSHDLHYVMQGTHRVVCLFHHICCSGKPGTVLKESAFQELYGMNVAEVLAHYSHYHTHTHETFEEAPS